MPSKKQNKALLDFFIAVRLMPTFEHGDVAIMSKTTNINNAYVDGYNDAIYEMRRTAEELGLKV
jgi:hypothetical protein